MLRLRGSVQHYAWGKPAASSLVAQLLCAGDSSVGINDQTQPYAELWLGTHPKGESIIWDSDEKLSEWIKKNNAAVGDEKLLKWCLDNDGQVPFLFKVLSVNKALSIQSHPTKKQAEELHARDPVNYPDGNHKPEMAIALTPFEMLCGFRPATEVLQNLKDTPELFELVGGEAFTQLQTGVDQLEQPDADPAQVDAAVRQGLKACFTALMRQPEVLVQRNVASLVERVALACWLNCALYPLALRTLVDTGIQRQLRHLVRFYVLRINAILPWIAVKSRKDADQYGNYILSELLIRLNFHFPGDVGVLAPFFLNHFVLQPGEAAFFKSNEPHAYLYGDCIECMACSDNTIRAGLTPKFKDVPTLCESLTYRSESAEKNKFLPVEKSGPDCQAGGNGKGQVLVYDPPVSEFVVHALKALPSQTVTISPLPTVSILIVCEGLAQILIDKKSGPVPKSPKLDGDEIKKGHFFVVPANFSAVLQCPVGDLPFLAYR